MNKIFSPVGVALVTNIGLCAAACYGMAKTKSVLPLVISGFLLMTCSTTKTSEG